MNKDVRKFCKQLQRLGFDVEIGTHIAVTLNGKRVTTLGVSPSDYRWMQNATRDIRRETGIVV